MAEDTAAKSYDAPQRECDLIMKGGVTSGLVYPQAVLELARSSPERPGYRFRAIGGASAGAVAAIFAAAAEFNRPSGFVELEKVNRQLQASDGTTSFLQRLFQAKPSMQPLLNIVLRLDDFQKYAAESGAVSMLRKLLVECEVPGLKRGALLWGLAGIAIAAALAGAIALISASPVFWRAWVVLGVVLGAAAGAAGWFYAGVSRLVGLATDDLPRNYFGICSGMKETPDATNAATEWIHASTQQIAGVKEVLTFGHLRCKGVSLELMTTNVSEGRPYAFPFDEPFLFCHDDFAKLFPAEVVQAMVDGGDLRRRTDFPGLTLPPSFHMMPAADELPVMVAARMSMSFPLFFSSVPLYALPLAVRERLEQDPAHQYEAQRDALIPHWFSDGGIASNFPIHFFDAWLPTRPTFGITLRYLPAFLFGAKTQEERDAARHYRDSLGMEEQSANKPLSRRLRALVDAPAAAGGAEHVVVLPRPQDTVPPEWSYISTPRQAPAAGAVPNFLWAVIGSMQNYRDNLQAALPSYRERVAQIRLKPDEGGFNLDMNEELIRSIVEKGALAGRKLDTEFVENHHRWVRLLVLAAQLEDGFRRIREKKTDEAFAELVDVQSREDGYPYAEKDGVVCEALRARLKALSSAMEAWSSAPPRPPFRGGTPPPVMRVTPKI